MKELSALYKQWKGTSPYNIEELPQAGSNRRYVRLSDEQGNSVIGVIGTSVKENECFIYLSNHFTERGLPMPRILATSQDHTRYIQEDLGSTSLYAALSDARKNGYQYGALERDLLEKTIRLLPHIQVEGAVGLDYEQCIPPIKFDQQAAMFDLNYFKYSFLKTTDLPFDEIRLETDMQQLAFDLTACSKGHRFFLYRDFQARNVMLKEGVPHFIDYQGGMEGPLQYDVASFLWQASAHYPQTLRDELVDIYIEELQSLLPDFDKEEFRKELQLFVMFRMMQVLGAYGLRGYVERKKYFLDSIPLAIQNMRETLNSHVANSYPYLNQILHELVSLPQFQMQQVEQNNIDECHNKQTSTKQTDYGKASVSKYDGRGPLVVRIFSFSYKKGIPEDTSGNGGGYVFDCRSTHNPGRYEQYKPLTGLDQPVIDFLENDGEILTFLSSVYKLADAHVERYMKRGFTDLMFSFGCTGGRHRSVYSAQHLAQHLHQKYGIEVRLCHREQQITTTFKSKQSKLSTSQKEVQD